LVALLQIGSCVHLGTPADFSRETPEEVFRAHDRFSKDRDYASLLECYDPSLRWEIAKTLRCKLAFDRELEALEEAMRDRYSTKEYQEKRAALDPLGERLCEYGSKKKRKKFCFDNATYTIRRGGNVVEAKSEDVSYGLYAVQYHGKWGLWSPGSYRSDGHRMLRAYINFSRKHMIRMRKEVLAGGEVDYCERTP
jgi:hypothetical protein